MIRTVLLLIAIACVLIGLPLLGVALAGRPLAPHLHFPPTTRFIAHAPFSWVVFALIGTLGVATLSPFVYRVLRARPVPVRRTVHAFPLWGWASLLLLGVSWWLAWKRFPWFAPWQSYTFTPIWLGYILVINALAFRRSARCMLGDRPGYFLALFPLSAAFWWFFEYLNRFVDNWHYVGAGELGPWQYFWQATLPFSTVLPAVLGTREYLAGFPRLSAGLADAWRLEVRAPKLLAALVLALAAAGLVLIGVWPNYLFSLLWISPLLVITALQALFGQPTIFAPAVRGDWRPLWQAALAALVCGFFWELWNYGSLTHWEYAVPWVHRFEVFHMPLLGYLGYLPFGLECLAVATLIGKRGTLVADHPDPAPTHATHHS